MAVRGAGPEDADAAPRPSLLRAVAEATGGGFSALPGGGMPRLAVNDPEVVEVGRRRAVPIWDRWWTLAGLAGLLACRMGPPPEAGVTGEGTPAGSLAGRRGHAERF